MTEQSVLNISLDKRYLGVFSPNIIFIVPQNNNLSPRVCWRFSFSPIQHWKSLNNLYLVSVTPITCVIAFSIFPSIVYSIPLWLSQIRILHWNKGSQASHSVSHCRPWHETQSMNGTMMVWMVWIDQFLSCPQYDWERNKEMIGAAVCLLQFAMDDEHFS